jgi:TonB-dependent starch-binding outer membrane protein SusC
MKKNECISREWKIPGLQKVLRIMKLTVFLLLLSVISVFAGKSYSQNKVLNLNLKNSTVKEVLRNIEKQSEFVFMYSEMLIDVNREVSVTVKNKKINEVLDELFAGTDVSYKVRDRFVLLTTPEVFKTDLMVQQQPAVSGTVTDEAGQPLPGVTVVVKGTTQGTVSNADGNYSLTNIPEDATLVFSFVGMLTQEVEVENQSVINVQMVTDVVGIEEVVAIGYGTKLRKNVTGSISSVKLEESPVSMTSHSNVLKTLKGIVPGLNIGTTQEAGSTPGLLIRGQNSIYGSNTPLIVLDGVIFMGSINDINPADIASVDILKDATSAAVYGSRAANGVLMINTKKGKQGKPKLRFSTSNGVNYWLQQPELQSLDDYMKKISDFTGTENNEWMSGSEKWNYDNGITYNMQDYWLRTGQLQDYALNVSGRSENFNYYLSGVYTDEKGVVINDDYNRISLTSKLGADITNWMQIGVTGNYTRSDFSALKPSRSLFEGYMNIWAPTYMSYYRGDPEDKLLERYPIGDPTAKTENPMWATQEDLNYNYDVSNNFRLATWLNIDVPFIEGLSYRLNYVAYYNSNKQEDFQREGYFISGGNAQNLSRYSPETIASKLGVAGGSMYTGNTYSFVIDNILSYKRQINEHYVDVTLAVTRDYSNNKGSGITGSDFSEIGNTTLGIDGLTKAATQTTQYNHTEVSNVGYVARFDYSLKDRYHFSSTFRRDGASVFGSENKWGNFPSIGLAWTVSNENFLKENTFINYLKIKSSYGKNGNQGISSYQTLTTLSTGASGGIRYHWSNDIGRNFFGSSITNLGNRSLGWETTTAFNMGIETSVLKERIIMNLDFYYSNTVDQLFVRQIPIMTGFSSIRASLGKVDNRGIEISLQTSNINRNDFKWSSGVIFWQNRNVLAELYGDGKDDLSNNLFIGHSLGAIYNFEWIDIVQEDDAEYIAATGAKPGDAKYKDLNDDGLISYGDDRKILGYEKPNFNLNISNTLNYRNFELYVLLTGTFGGNGYYLGQNPKAFLAKYGDYARSPGLAEVEYWTPENQSHEYPGIMFRIDDRFIGLQSRTFVKIQDIVLSYEFKNDLLKRMKIDMLRAHTSIQNLYTFTGWTGGDAEAGYGVFSGNYPIPATFEIGFDIGF